MINLLKSTFRKIALVLLAVGCLLPGFKAYAGLSFDQMQAMNGSELAAYISPDLANLNWQEISDRTDSVRQFVAMRGPDRYTMSQSEAIEGNQASMVIYMKSSLGQHAMKSIKIADLADVSYRSRAKPARQAFPMDIH